MSDQCKPVPLISADGVDLSRYAGPLYYVENNTVLDTEEWSLIMRRVEDLAVDISSGREVSLHPPQYKMTAVIDSRLFREYPETVFTTAKAARAKVAANLREKATKLMTEASKMEEQE